VTRLADWPERLAAFLESRRTMPKQWGQNDCALFCADAIQAMTGVDPALELRGYDSEFGAIKAMVKYWIQRGVLLPGWKQRPDSLLCELAARMAEIHGFEAIATGLAGRGDAVLLEVGDLMSGEEKTEGRQDAGATRWTRALGIVGMNGLPVTAGQAGTVQLGAERIVRAWRI